MMKKNRDEQHALPKDQRLIVDAEDAHLRGAEECGKRELARMKTNARRHVEIGIEMMRAVEVPQHWRVMIQPMPPPERVIEKKHTGERA